MEQILAEVTYCINIWQVRHRIALKVVVLLKSLRIRNILNIVKPDIVITLNPAS